jgi:hypothetical protein
MYPDSPHEGERRSMTGGRKEKGAGRRAKLRVEG